jgi:hypothetical protein
MAAFKDDSPLRSAQAAVGVAERSLDRGVRRRTRLRQPQQDAALRYLDDAERNLRKLRKALKKGNVSLSAELLSAVQSDAARVLTVLAFAGAAQAGADSPDPR